MTDISFKANFKMYLKELRNYDVVNFIFANSCFCGLFSSC